MYFEATPHQPPSAPKAVFGINHGFAHAVPVEFRAASATASTPTFAVCTPRARAKYVFCVDCTSTATRRFATSTLTFTSAAATGWPRTELLRATWSAFESLDNLHFPVCQTQTCKFPVPISRKN